VVESGTGTTAAFLAKHLSHCVSQYNVVAKEKPHVEVVAVSCVMSPEQLMKAMEDVLGIDSDCRSTYNEMHALSVLPYPAQLLQKFNNKRRVFGQPVREHYELWRMLIDEWGVVFDLVYAPAAWEQLLHSPQWGIKRDASDCGAAWDNTANIIYVHCGGVEGNVTQLMRYRHKFHVAIHL
jgi:1-aminocyclopropane-1-carboxylate deaminase/D-cysteine desulfhydrase-like pyridoxal-dependent ACC family enzyme